MTTKIWWIRRDLRISDNEALQAALAGSESMAPVFILDPALLGSDRAGTKRIAFLFDGLRELDHSLRQRGSRLIVREGQPLEQLMKLKDELGAVQIAAERNFSPYAEKRDGLIGQNLPLKLVEGFTIKPFDLVVKADGSPYTVYTPFSKRWRGLPDPAASSLRPAPEYIHTPDSIASIPIPEEPVLPDSVPFAPGEAKAQSRLGAFLMEDSSPSILEYANKRDRMDLAGTSGLSPYLRFGMLSARQVFVELQELLSKKNGGEGRHGAETWLNELIWREFYISVLYYHPHVMEGSFRPVYDRICWLNKEEQFRAWCEGRTGYPVVDAAMRQLSSWGWMHNRARMIAASFLVKDLLVDWRWGERWFMQHLVDGDPAANNGGWQWTAGTGTDAAPYFRIFNPVLQGKKHDPHGGYVRRWVPELEPVPNKFIHEPWRMPIGVQQDAGVVIGRDYPRPIVEHKEARQRTLEAYAKARDGGK